MDRIGSCEETVTTRYMGAKAGKHRDKEQVRVTHQHAHTRASCADAHYPEKHPQKVGAGKQ